MTLDELRDLDPNKPGGWPLPIKALAWVALAGAIIGGVYWFLVKDQYLVLKQERQKEPQLRSDFQAKQRLAASLPLYQRQMDEIQVKFGGLLDQLPNKNEVDKVLDDISQTRVAAGADELLFRPEGERKRDFYAELPISIELTGTYRELGEYAQGIASLSRIVSLHEMRMAPEGGGSDPVVTMVFSAKTYRYLEDE